jgi:hypothetical protein
MVSLIMPGCWAIMPPLSAWYSASLSCWILFHCQHEFQVLAISFPIISPTALEIGIWNSYKTLENLQVTAATAYDLQAVCHELALQVVLLSDIGTLHGLEDPVGTTEVHGDEEANAGSIDWGVALKGWGFAETMVSLAEGDTRTTAGHEA